MGLKAPERTKNGEASTDEEQMSQEYEKRRPDWCYHSPAQWDTHMFISLVLAPRKTPGNFDNLHSPNLQNIKKVS